MLLASKNFSESFLSKIPKEMKKLVLLLLVLHILKAGNLSFAANYSADAAKELQAPGSSQLISDWINVHLAAIRNCKIPSHHMRQLAYMGTALYESVVAGVPEYVSLANQLNGYTTLPIVPNDKDFSWQASANAAYAATFRYFYAENTLTLKRIDSMEQACINKLVSQGISDAAIRNGSQYGANVAKAVIDWSNTDGADKISAPYTIPVGPGYWEPTPPAFIPPIIPYMGSCRTFVKGSTDNAFPQPPIAYSEDPQSPFYKMVDELYQSSKVKDAANIATALFWDDFPNGMTLTGGGHWESILKTVINQLNMSLIEAARVYAGLFITAQDASIGCFKAKYTYNLLRPVTYIQKTMKHPEWNPLIITPPHPEYPAAHATISMSAATILTHLLGNNIDFTDNSYSYRGYKAHHFNNFVEAGTEAGLSRFYGGIHYKPSIKAGYEQGRKIGDNVAKVLVFKKTEQMTER